MICVIDENNIIINIIARNNIIANNEKIFYPWNELWQAYTDEMPEFYANKTKAQEAKENLQHIAINAMMATLAGGDITARQVEYQSNIATLSDDVALLIPEVYPLWSGDGKEYKKDERVTYYGELYKVLTNHTSQATWTPTDAPSLFAKVLTAQNEILEWEQPNANNVYMKGDKVKYEGKIYENLIDNNVWKPTEYPAGWKEITKTQDKVVVL